MLQARARRASAPPAPLASSRGATPLERQLQFHSNSLGAAPAVPDMRLLAGGGGSPLPVLVEGEEGQHEMGEEGGQAQKEGHQPAVSALGPTPEDALKVRRRRGHMLWCD